jgi:hypothetical protein
MTQWRFLDDEEYEVLKKRSEELFPPPRKGHDPRHALHNVYPTSGFGSVVDKDGDAHLIDPGEWIKVFENDPPDEAWVVFVQDITLVMPGGNRVDLKRGAPVAVLPEEAHGLL